MLYTAYTVLLQDSRPHALYTATQILCSRYFSSRCILQYTVLLQDSGPHALYTTTWILRCRSFRLKFSAGCRVFAASNVMHCYRIAINTVCAQPRQSCTAGTLVHAARETPLHFSSHSIVTICYPQRDFRVTALCCTCRMCMYFIRPTKSLQCEMKATTGW